MWWMGWAAMAWGGPPEDEAHTGVIAVLRAGGRGEGRLAGWRDRGWLGR